jgi:hypothetical protein
MAKRDEPTTPLAIDGHEPPVGTPERTDGVVSGVGLNQPTDGGPALALDPDETIAEERRREGPLAIRDLEPARERPRRSPRFRLPKG